ncbi:MAG: porin family protein [Candidatus Amoebophilus sp.]
MLYNNTIKVICFSILFFSSFFCIHAENPSPSQEIQAPIPVNTQKIKLDPQQRIKFGPQLGTGIFAGSLRLGIVGEYKLAEWLSIQAGILYFRNQYFLKGTFPNSTETLALVLPQHITVPLVLRGYLKPDKKMSFFAGVHVGYLVGGFLEWHKTMLTRKYIASLHLNDERLAAKKLGYAFLLGSDYQFNYGITVGLTFIYELTKVIATDRASLNWTLAPTLNYNLGMFLRQISSPTNPTSSTSHFYDLEEHA